MLESESKRTWQGNQTCIDLVKYQAMLAAHERMVLLSAGNKATQQVSKVCLHPGLGSLTNSRVPVLIQPLRAQLGYRIIRTTANQQRKRNCSSRSNSCHQFTYALHCMTRLLVYFQRFSTIKRSRVIVTSTWSPSIMVSSLGWSEAQHDVYPQTITKHVYNLNLL